LKKKEFFFGNVIYNLMPHYMHFDIN